MTALQEIAQLRQRLEELEKQEQEKHLDETLKTTSMEYNLNNLETIVEIKKGERKKQPYWAKIAGTKWPHEFAKDSEERKFLVPSFERVVSEHYEKNLSKGGNGNLSYLEAILGALKIIDKRISNLEEKINTHNTN